MQRDDKELPGSVLFACNMNSVRSPMAAAIMRHLFGRAIHVDSTGVKSGELDPFAIEVMHEIGINISQHSPKAFDELYDSSFDLIVSLTPQAHHQALEFTRAFATETEYWPTFDPTDASGHREQILAAYRNVRDHLLSTIKKRFGEGLFENP